MDEIVLTDPAVAPILFHKQKQQILGLLINQEMNIIDLKHATGENPGSIKRHLTDLLDAGLIAATRQEMSQNGILMRFYRARARSYFLQVRWP